MINIVYIIPCFRKCGPVNVVLDIIRNLPKSEYNIIVVALREENTSQNIKQHFEEQGVTIFQLAFSSLMLYLYPSFAADYLKKHILSKYVNPIIHSHCLQPNMVAAKIDGVNKITTNHNISSEDYISARGRFIGSFFSKVYNNTLKQFDVAVVLSDYMRMYYDGMCDTIVKIPNGVTVTPIDEAKVNDLKTRLGVPLDKKILTVAGFISERKNVKYIIQELNTLSKDYLCLIVGNGDRVEECKEAAIDNPKICFTGYKLNVEDYLAITDIYISASKSEGLPLSVLEAVNKGLPCVLSDIPPHREIVETLKVEGVCLFPLRKSALAASLLEIWNTKHETASISKRGFDEYSAAVMSSRYQDLYKSCLYRNKI